MDRKYSLAYFDIYQTTHLRVTSKNFESVAKESGKKRNEFRSFQYTYTNKHIHSVPFTDIRTYGYKDTISDTHTHMEYIGSNNECVRLLFPLLPSFDHRIVFCVFFYDRIFFDRLCSANKTHTMHFSSSQSFSLSLTLFIYMHLVALLGCCCCSLSTMCVCLKHTFKRV